MPATVWGPLAPTVAAIMPERAASRRVSRAMRRHCHRNRAQPGASTASPHPKPYEQLSTENPS